ncbi:hypothetical protein HOLleu_11903 [Holothuria leucospilota]|uniref:G-protein coupled receptors family 1 profile domain-containing protein n=1 Tax=Holothuria leucospilota TaxID=206669 RepID=A0A9Q1CAK0_HOLLE|nr:hypothetical protein HOLleu_11903 [Holothuria leucospilota]
MDNTIFETIEHPHRLAMFITILDPTKSVSQVVHVTSWIVLIICGFVTNGVFLYTLLSNLNMRKHLINRLLMILSILDILILMNEILYIAYPLFVTKVLRQRPAFHTPLVIISVWFYTFLEHCCGALFVVIAYERYVAICFPLKYYSSNDHYPLAKLMTIAFTLSALFTGVFAVVFYLCNITAVWAFYLLLFAPPLVPFIISGALYIRVVCTMFIKSPLDSQSNSNRRCNARRIYRRRVVLVLVINTLVFFVLNTLRKFFDSQLAQAFMKNNLEQNTNKQYAFIEEEWHWASYMTYCTVLNSTVNPIIYNMGSSQYRHALYQSFSCLNRCHGNQHSSHTCPPLCDVRDPSTITTRL